MTFFFDEDIRQHIHEAFEDEQGQRSQRSGHDIGAMGLRSPFFQGGKENVGLERIVNLLSEV